MKSLDKAWHDREPIYYSAPPKLPTAVIRSVADWAAAYRLTFSSMPESMDFKDLDSTVILTPDECWEAYRHHRYSNPWFNLTEVNINRPTSHSYISKGHHDKSGKCIGETFVRQGDLHTSVYERTEVRLLVQEHLLHTLPGVLSSSGMDLNLPFNVRVPAERQNLTDERFGVMVWQHDEPKCAKEVQYTSVYYNLFTGSVDVHYRWIPHNSAAFPATLLCTARVPASAQRLAAQQMRTQAAKLWEIQD